MERNKKENIKNLRREKKGIKNKNKYGITTIITTTNLDISLETDFLYIIDKVL